MLGGHPLFIREALPQCHPRFRKSLTAAHHAHGKDGVVGHLRVSIMGELAEGVQDVQAGVGDRDESQGQGHSSAKGRLPVPQLRRSDGKG